MRVVSPLDLRRSLGAILDAASAGERFVIERDHRPLAMLVSVEDGRRLEPDAEEARARRLVALDRLAVLGRRSVPSRPLAGPGGVALPAPLASPLAQATVPPAVPQAPAGRGRSIDRYEAERRRHAAEGEVVPGG
jgi:antitoxin (DNA-binding transcriptional repressor) of toxin-antitoxin stability system